MTKQVVGRNIYFNHHLIKVEINRFMTVSFHSLQQFLTVHIKYEMRFFRRQHKIFSYALFMQVNGFAQSADLIKTLSSRKSGTVGRTICQVWNFTVHRFCRSMLKTAGWPQWCERYFLTTVVYQPDNLLSAESQICRDSVSNFH